MLLANIPIPETLRSTTKKSGRIVWQERYEGVALVAYQNGRALACVSGPWSDRYVLTWWAADVAPQLELFDSIEAARLAVEQSVRNERQIGDPLAAAPRRSALSRWGEAFGRLFSRKRARDGAWQTRNVEELRRHHFGEETDLSGLHFRAFR
ncbi:MAG TPA: hypothetical protein VF132_12715 [Rudaea sp.]